MFTRVLAYHRWLEGFGRDAVVIATLREATHYDYRIGMPRAGRWREAFNSDVYDNWVNPVVAGNGGAVFATDSPLHGLPASASVVIPANRLSSWSATVELIEPSFARARARARA